MKANSVQLSSILIFIFSTYTHKQPTKAAIYRISSPKTYFIIKRVSIESIQVKVTCAYRKDFPMFLIGMIFFFLRNYCRIICNIVSLLYGFNCCKFDHFIH